MSKPSKTTAYDLTDDQAYACAVLLLSNPSDILRDLGIWEDFKSLVTTFHFKELSGRLPRERKDTLIEALTDTKILD